MRSILFLWVQASIAGILPPVGRQNDGVFSVLPPVVSMMADFPSLGKLPRE
jgi:hypothetical protein